MLVARRTSLVTAVLFWSLLACAAAQAPGPAGPRPALIPCEATTTGPCMHVATSIDDIVGVWKQFFGNPMIQAPGGVAFVRYHPDGTISLADSVENTAAPYGMYPRGRVTFDGEVMTIEVEGDQVPAECRRATAQVQVIRYGSIPVALFQQAIEDACLGRLADLRTPLIWVGE
jgi:hypothetical protein